MIVKHHKGFNTVIVAIAVSVIIIALTFSSTNFDTISEPKINTFKYDISQKILSKLNR